MTGTHSVQLFKKLFNEIKDCHFPADVISIQIIYNVFT